MTLYTNKISGTSSIRYHDFVVIGAGTAGLMATKELYNEGYENILTLEARDRTGGRINTINHFKDVGAAGFHVPPEAMRKNNTLFEVIMDFCDNNNIKLQKEYPKFVLYRNGKRISDGEVNAAIDRIEAAMQKTSRGIKAGEISQDITLFKALEHLYGNETCRALIDTQYSHADAGLATTHISFLDRYNTMAPTFCLYPNKGMAHFLDQFTRETKDYISLNKEVNHIGKDKATGMMAVKYKDNETGTDNVAYAREVIITVPVGVLKQWIKKNIIELPADKTAAINNIEMGHFCKNILMMKEKFYRENDGINNLSNLIISSARYNSNNIFFVNKPLISQYVGDEMALQYQKKGKNYAADKALKILASAGVFGDYHYLMKMMEDNYLTNWDNDDLSRGAYTGSAKDETAREIYAKPFGHIHFAGEGCSYKNSQDHTYILGALNSGIIVAHEAIKSLNQQIAPYRK